MKILKTLLLVLFVCNFCYAQDFPVTRNVEQAYVKATRDRNGKPGKGYWQNNADYDIKVSFNPVSREIKGMVNISYTNNSPDTLKTLAFKLYPNIFKNSSMRNYYLALSDLSTGMHLNSLKVDHRESDLSNRVIFGTNMDLNGNEILPGQKVQIEISYDYVLNKGSFIRTGQVDSGAFVIAYFFPRITVYDDIDGWNEYPYRGKEEFYNDYGNFNAEITVPGDYQIWATGDLVNPREVYQPGIVQRIDQAEKNDGITDVITVGDLKDGQVTWNNATNTWKFKAVQVTDFAFALSNHYVWKASSVLVDSLTKRRTRVDAVYHPDHQVYEPVIGYARKTVELISHHFPKVPFPYPHQTIFEGLDAMEYPMMVNNLPFKEKQQTIEITAHEVFHALFPFYVGTNETKHSFMDEGWATLAEFYLSPMIDPEGIGKYDISTMNNSAGTDEDVPVITPTAQLYGKARFTDKDLKPALALLYLKEMMGDDLFLKATHYYIRSWHGKHPTPYDFFNCMSAGSGLNLNWFWKNWFIEKNVPDLAISKVSRHKLNYAITVSSPGSLSVPIHLTVIYNDGSSAKMSRNIGCWAKKNKVVILRFKAGKKVKEIILGNAFDVDIRPEDNHWKSH